jgi:hypothetical protein
MESPKLSKNTPAAVIYPYMIRFVAKILTVATSLPDIKKTAPTEAAFSTNQN